MLSAVLGTLVLFSTQVPDLTLTVERCFSDAASAEAVFGPNSNSLTVDRRGRVYVSGNLSRNIMRFSAESGAPDILGRPGDGPGEFRSQSLLGTHGDSVWAFDMGARRMSLFGPEGQFVRVVLGARQLGRLGLRFVPRGIFADGRIVGAESLHLGRTGASRNVPILALTMDAGRVAQIDTLAEVYQSDTRMPVRINGMVMVIGGALDLSSHWRVSADGERVVILDQWPAPDMPPGQYRIRVVTASGEVASSSLVPYEPIAFSREVRERIAATHASRMLDGENGVPFQPAVLQAALAAALPGPEFLPPVTAVTLGTEGEILVRREMPDRTGARWELLGRTGRVLGRFDVADGFEIGWLEDRRLWAVRRDSLDVPALCRFELSNPPS